MEQGPIVEFRNVSKKFPGSLANDGISFSIIAGEVHAIVGENGAGKSTLMKLLAGLYLPDGGNIMIRGREGALTTPGQAILAGIGMVHQHFMLVECFTVLQNIMLGCEGSRCLLHISKVRVEVGRICSDYGMALDLDAEISSLSVGIRQQVEIIKLLYRGGDILIFDEPTAVLTPGEAEGLLVILRKLQAQGKTILYISHKISEVLRIANRITVLRQGRFVETVEAQLTSREQLAALMIGRNLNLVAGRRKIESGSCAMLMDNVYCRSRHGNLALRGISLGLKKGEIYGLAGVAGNGQQELAAVVTGRMPAEQGEVFLGQDSLRGKNAAEVHALGIGIIPEDRSRQGLIPDLSVWENFMLGQIRQKEYSRFWQIFLKRCQTFAAEKVSEFDIRVHSVDQSSRSLSGGNQQKIILAREMSAHPKVLIACQPVRGLDIGAEEFVHRRLQEARDSGMAVLLISSDLDEVRALSDRVGILYNGRIVKEFCPDELSLQEIGCYMLGGTPESLRA